MRIYKNDIIKASAISTGADRGVLLCSIIDSGFTSILLSVILLLFYVLYKYKERIPSQAGAPFNKNEKTNINMKIRFLLLMF